VKEQEPSIREELLEAADRRRSQYREMTNAGQ
jgi:hypothetical protein